MSAVAWCMWCNHEYEVYTPMTEDNHFALNCPDAPDALKKEARFRLERLLRLQEMREEPQPPMHDYDCEPEIWHSHSKYCCTADCRACAEENSAVENKAGTDKPVEEQTS